MDRSTTILVDGLGAVAATSGILSQLQRRIFAPLLHATPALLVAVAVPTWWGAFSGPR